MDPVLLAIAEGIASALLVSAGGYILLRSRSSVKKRRALSQRHTQLARRLLAAGVSNFYVGRAEWQKYREPALLKDYLASAQETVQIASYWMAQGAIDGIPKSCRELVQHGRRIEIVLIDPDSVLPEVLSADLELPPATIRANVRASLDVLFQVKSALSNDEAARYTIKLSRTLPQAAVILIDAGRPGAKIQLELRPYRAARADSFSFEVQGKDSGPLYAVLFESWRKYFEDALITEGSTAPNP